MLQRTEESGLFNINDEDISTGMIEIGKSNSTL